MKKPRRTTVVLAASTPRPSKVPAAETEIRTLRAASNHAIATADLATLATTFSDDFIVILGDGTLLSRAAYLEAFAHTFQQPTLLRYERIADTIRLSASLPLAAEHGHWIGSLTEENGVDYVLFTGTYAAMWRKEDATWKLRSELFVSLT